MSEVSMMKELLVPSVLLAGPLCGQEFAIAKDAPAVAVFSVPGGDHYAYERTARTERESGRWVWRYMCRVGRKGGAA